MKILALILCAVLSLASAGAARADDWPPAAWSKPSKPYRVVGNIYYVGSEGLSSYLITSSEGHMLLDAGMSAEGAKLVERNIVSLGFKLSDVKILLNTHAHYDHAGGLAQMKADTGAKLYASSLEKPALEAGRHFGDNENGLTPFPAVKVDRTIGEGQKITLGETTLIVRLTPGHTIGGTAFTTSVTERGRPLNVVLFNSISVAGNALVGNKTYPRIVSDYRATFAKLKTIPCDVFLPAHPEQGDLVAKRQRFLRGDLNAFIDPAELGRVVAASEVAFNKELARQQGAAK
ncbi:MAG: subclass B3 metallo-beta-lactamase [Alphaproteobacteria bacterium]|nr:subclass B3 metallo-beta-lactamase [Alphaproteobacteria bacterium]